MTIPANELKPCWKCGAPAIGSGHLVGCSRRAEYPTPCQNSQWYWESEWQYRPIEDALSAENNRLRALISQMGNVAEIAGENWKEKFEQERKWRNYYEEHYTDLLRDSGAISESLERHHAALKDIDKLVISKDSPIGILAEINHITTECLKEGDQSNA